MMMMMISEGELFPLPQKQFHLMFRFFGSQHEESLLIESIAASFEELYQVFMSLPDAPSVVSGRTSYGFMAEKCQMLAKRRFKLSQAEFEALCNVTRRGNQKMQQLFQEWMA
jgi:hypothetical protein